MKPAASLGITGRIGDRVYQHVHPGLGNVPSDPTRSLQNRAYVAHNTSHTHAQLECRARFKDAVDTWHTLTPEQQQDFAPRAKQRRISPFNQYISLYIRR